MNNYITKAVITRLKADTGAGGLYAGSTWALTPGGVHYYAAPSAARPYIVLNVNQQEDHALTADTGDFTLVVRMVADLNDGGDQLQSIWNRVFGDAMLQTGRIPKYGLNRHILTLGTNPLSAVCSELIYAGSGDVEAADADTIAWEMSFKGRWQASATSP